MSKTGFIPYVIGKDKGIPPSVFQAKMAGFKRDLTALFAESKTLASEIKKPLERLTYEQ